MWSDAIAFSSVVDVAALSTPRNSFHILTSDSRRLVFQCRPTASTSEINDLDDGQGEIASAEMWCSQLDYLCGLDQPREELTTLTPNLEHDADIYQVDGDQAARMRQLVADGDVEQLLSMIQAASIGGEDHRTIIDEEGNSLLLLALKFCSDADLPVMVEQLANLRVACNKRNLEYVSSDAANCC